MGRLVKLVEISKRALKDLKKIKSFNTNLYGKTKSKEIIEKIKSNLIVLENPINDFSKIGSIDNDFAHLKYKYRKLIVNHYKITYREGKEKIFIIRFFDTRQHPNKNK